MKHALVREPGRNFPDCISSHPLWHTINIDNARQQHQNYCETLEELGLEVIRLPRLDKHPDSCFVEDTAIIFKDKAFIARLCAESRRGEENSVEDVLSQYKKTKRAVSPATVEGGDIVNVYDKIICGITKRTNMNGATQLAGWLSVKVETLVDPFLLHLKSHVSYLGKNIIVSTKDLANETLLSNFKVLVVPDNEKFAANCLAVDGTVLIPINSPNTQALIRDVGFTVLPINISEFQKCDGAITCLSILF